MTTKKELAFLLLAVCWPSPVTAQAPQPERGRPSGAVVVLRCGFVLDVRAGKLLPDQIVLVSGSKISAVGSASSVKIPAGAATIDLTKTVVLPGLIDVHTHLVDDSSGPYDSAEPLKKSAAQMAFESIRNARATLEAGFTSVRDLGTFRAFVDVALRDAIEQGIIPGPRMQPAGAYVTISGGAGAITGIAPDIELPRELRFGQADGPDQVRQRVREIIRNGAGVIKVLATGAITTWRSQPAAQEFTYDELRAAVEEASKAGLKVAAHAHSSAGAKDAIRAGVASIEHGTLLDEEALQLMKERGTFLSLDIVPSWAFWPGGTPEGKPPGYPDEFVEKERISLEQQARVARRALELGVRIAFATDAGVIPHGQNARLFALYVKHGFTALAAIQAATLSAAELLGWSDRLGSIEAGKLADIIAVRENPLQDITSLERVVFVMKGGQVFKNTLR